MAAERGDRGHTADRYPRREDSERDRRERRHDEPDDRERRESEDEGTRPSERRHWRGHDYYQEEEFERGRDYGPYDRARERSIRAEHGDRFLRRAEDEHRSARHGETQPYEWRGRDAYRDDDRGAGPYVGRGPKGYRRSDERIQEDVCQRLTEHPNIDASDMEVKVEDGDVTLTGRVESRAMKHLAENVVEAVSGVKEVHNQLRVMAPMQPPDDRQEPRER